MTQPRRFGRKRHHQVAGNCGSFADATLDSAKTQRRSDVAGHGEGLRCKARIVQVRRRSVRAFSARFWKLSAGPLGEFIMERTWISKFWGFATAAGVGGACWIVSSGLAVAQTTTSDTNQSTGQTSGAASSTDSTRSGSTSQSTSRSSQSGRTSNDDTQGVGGTYSNQTGRYGSAQSGHSGTNQSGYSQSGSNQFGSSQSGYGQASSGQNRTPQYGATQSDYGQGAYSNQSRDSSRQGLDSRTQSQSATDHTHDSIGQPRDDMRSGRNQFQDNRGQFPDNRGSNRFGQDQSGREDRDDFRNQNRDFDRDNDRDELTNQNRGQRDFSRDNDRDEFGSQSQNQRSFGRDNDRDDFRNQSQRDFSRDNQRDQFSSERGQSFQDNRGFQSNQFQSGRSDQRQNLQGSAQSNASGRSSQTASSQAQINRAADLGLWFNRNNRNGLVISDVSSSGPISQAGFREGDQIMSINGQRVTSEQQFLNTLLSPQLMNQRAQVLVWRNGQQVPLWVAPWTLVQNQGGTYAQADALQPYGIVLDDRYSSPVVWKVQPQSPAYYAGIRSNDIIVAWNGQHVNDSQELEHAAQQTQQSEIPVQVSRNRQLRELTLEADGQTRTALRPSYEESSSQQDGYAQPQTFQQGGYTQGQTFQQGYAQPQTFQQGTYTQQPQTFQQGSYAQPGTTYTQPQQGTYYQQPTYQQQNRPGILPWIRGR
jgi:hypothetical protein